MLQFAKRTAAYLIDCTIAFAIVMILIQWAFLSQFREQWGITDDWFRDSFNMEMYVLFSISLPVWLYFTILDSKLSKGTIGKRIVKLSVRNQSNKEKISLGKSFLRTVMKLLPWEIAHLGVIFPEPLYFQENPEIQLLTYFGIVLFAIYVLSILTNKEARSVYDRILGTMVFSEKTIA